MFFSSPLDLDFAMLQQFPAAYGVEEEEDFKAPDDKTIAAVLGKSHGNVNQYSEAEQQYFDVYHRRFKLGSKPAVHLEAMAQLDDTMLSNSIPSRLIVCST